MLGSAVCQAQGDGCQHVTLLHCALCEDSPASLWAHVLHIHIHLVAKGYNSRTGCNRNGLGCMYNLVHAHPVSDGTGISKHLMQSTSSVGGLPGVVESTLSNEC